MLFWISILIFVILPAAGCERQQSDSRQTSATAKFTQVSSAVLADTSSGHQIFTIDTPSSRMSPNYTVIFSKAGNGVAYKAERNGQYYVVNNGIAGKPYQEVSDLTFSPDGKRLAYVAQNSGKSIMVVDNRESTEVDAAGSPIFSSDSKHLLYYAKIKDKWHLILDGRMDEGGLSIYDQFFNSDASKVISFEQVDSDANSPISLLKIRDLKLKLLASRRLSVSNRAYSPDRTRMAAIENVKEKMRLIEVDFNNVDTITSGPLYDGVSLVSFSNDGKSVAYIAERAAQRFLVLNGKEYLLPPGEVNEPPVINPAKNEAAVIIASAKGYDVCLIGENGIQRKHYKEAAFFRYSKDGAAYAHIALNRKLQQYVVNGRPGPSFDKSLPPLFSPDGKYVVCRVRQDGQRFIVVLDMDGKLVRQHPAYEMVFEPVFLNDGRSLGYGVKDGQKLVWKVEKLP